MEDSTKDFVTINYIDCEPEYKERFEELFGAGLVKISRDVLTKGKIKIASNSIFSG